MITSSPLQSAAYQACLDEAFTQCPFIINRWSLGLTKILHERSVGLVASYEKRVFQNAASALKVNQPVIEEGLALELAEAIALDIQGSRSKKVDGAAHSFSSLRFDQLELMGDDQVQEALEEARLQQFLRLSSDVSLAEFSARLSTAQGFKVVQADKNPLRPEVFSEAFVKLLRRLPVDKYLRSRWLTLGAQLLGKELQAFYELLTVLLEKQGVVPAPYGVVGAPKDNSRKSGGPYGLGEQAGYAGQATFPAQAAYEAQRGYGERGYPAPAYFGQSTGPQQAVYLSDAPSDQARYLAGAGYVGQPAHLQAGGDSGPGEGAGRVPRFWQPGDLVGRVQQNHREPLGADGSARVSREQLLTLDHLHHLMVGHYDESFQHAQGVAAHPGAVAVQQDFLQTVPAAMDALAELQKQGLAEITGNRARRMPPLPIALLREQLKAEAKSLGQALGIEVVGLMIEKLTSDERLLPPVRKLIANAEPAFLRLGMTDPRFFSDKAHPARQLLEAITANSLAYPSEDAPGFAQFMRDLEDVAAVLTEVYLSDAHDFAALLADFEQKQARHSRETSDAQHVAVKALLRAEQRNLLAEKIALEIRLRPDFISGNRTIASFLTGPWAHVMANERLLGEHGGIGSAKAVYSLTLGDLLWSLNVLQASRHRRRLVKIIPGMLDSIREGLLSIDYPLDESQAFYDELMATHQLAIKPATDKTEAHPFAHGVSGEFLESGDEDGNTEPWLAPTEAQQSGFMEEWAADGSDSESTIPRQPDEARIEPGRQEVNQPNRLVKSPSGSSTGLLLGAWVELLSDNRWVRAQLTWISPHNTLFMFTSDGGRSHSMTTRMLQQLLSAGRLQIISDQGLLDGALDGVARTAMRNSVDIGADT